MKRNITKLFIAILLIGAITITGLSTGLLDIASAKVVKGTWVSVPELATGALTITNAKADNDNLIIKGETAIDPAVSTYIQYYVGKKYEGTTTNCIYCAGINADVDGTFSLELPLTKLKGSGVYEVVFEQNPNSDSIIGPEHWMAFYKDNEGALQFGDISSMGELSNLAMTVGMEIVGIEVTVPGPENCSDSNALSITSASVVCNNVVIEGETDIDSAVSTYIQYYVGKKYEGTTTNCIYCAGINADVDGTFSLELSLTKLKGSGVYEIVFEQNPNSDSIIGPEHWMAFYKDNEGDLQFGDISSMGELSNLALTVGMEIVETQVTVS